MMTLLRYLWGSEFTREGQCSRLLWSAERQARRSQKVQHRQHEGRRKPNRSRGRLLSGNLRRGEFRRRAPGAAQGEEHDPHSTHVHAESPWARPRKKRNEQLHNRCWMLSEDPYKNRNTEDKRGQTTRPCSLMASLSANDPARLTPSDPRCYALLRWHGIDRSAHRRIQTLTSLHAFFGPSSAHTDNSWRSSIGRAAVL